MSLWRTGWRTAVRWVFVAALGIEMVLWPLVQGVLALFGVDVPPLPGPFSAIWEKVARIAVGGDI